VGQELEESHARLVQLPGLHEDGAAAAEQFAVEEGKPKGRGGEENDDALGIAGRLGPAFLDGAKNGRQGHGIMGTSLFHFHGMLSFER
jgi:hypothetical protein